MTIYCKYLGMAKYLKHAKYLPTVCICRTLSTSMLIGPDHKMLLESDIIESLTFYGNKLRKCIFRINNVSLYLPFLAATRLQ